MGDSKHYGQAVCLYNDAMQAFGERKRKLYNDALAELEQAIEEDGKIRNIPLLKII